MTLWEVLLMPWDGGVLTFCSDFVEGLLLVTVATQYLEQANGKVRLTIRLVWDMRKRKFLSHRPLPMPLGSSVTFAR